MVLSTNNELETLEGIESRYFIAIACGYKWEWKSGIECKVCIVMHSSQIYAAIRNYFFFTAF